MRGRGGDAGGIGGKGAAGVHNFRAGLVGKSPGGGGGGGPSCQKGHAGGGNGADGEVIIFGKGAFPIMIELPPCKIHTVDIYMTYLTGRAVCIYLEPLVVHAASYISDNGVGSFKAYCDMERGGWTLLMHQRANECLPANTETVGKLNGLTDHSFRLGTSQVKL
jgi:hypothetical protein